MTQKNQKNLIALIAENRKAYHDYVIENDFEAGLALQGWEVKSLREGRGQLKDSYIHLKNGEAWLIGAHISALKSASTHIEPDAQRTRKLLLNRRELAKLFTGVQQKGYTVIALNLHWSRQHIKAKIALVKGKKTHNKRDSLKRRDIERETQRLLKR